MVFYYDSLDKQKISKLAVELGRAGHAIRNYTQGYVVLSHPEILTLDNLAGQIEGQCRAIRSNIEIQGEIKPLTKNVYKSANFLKRILSEDFYKDEMIDSIIIKEIRNYIDLMITNIKIIEREINMAILKESANIFENDMPLLPEITTNIKVQNQLNDLFDNNIEKDIKYNTILNIDEFKTMGLKIWNSMSNKAHSTQDVISNYLNIQPIADNANKIVNHAGNIENSARAVITELVTFKKKINGKLLIKQKDNILEQLKIIQGIIEIKDFHIQEKKDELQKILEWQKRY